MIGGLAGGNVPMPTVKRGVAPPLGSDRYPGGQSVRPPVGEHLSEDLPEPGHLVRRRFDDGLDFAVLQPKVRQSLGVQHDAKDVAVQDGFAHAAVGRPLPGRDQAMSVHSAASVK